MHIVSLIKKITVAGIFLILSACISTDSFISEAEPEKFDGVWSGLITLSIGDQTCMRRENFMLRISQGQIAGKTRDIKYKTNFKGIIGDDGTVINGAIELGTLTRNSDFQGSFSEKDASGTWQSKRCKGKWTLRKIQ